MDYECVFDVGKNNVKSYLDSSKPQNTTGEIFGVVMFLVFVCVRILTEDFCISVRTVLQEAEP